MPNSAFDLAEAFYHLRELEYFDTEGEHLAAGADLRVLIERAGSLDAAEFRLFAADLIRFVSAVCVSEARNAGVLDRAFDGLDEIFGINYLADVSMSEAPSSERLYARAGAAVQTSYSTIFKALTHSRLPPGAHLVDLGSGFGRVGLAAGLWRTDLAFTGYEFVDHRVVASSRAAEKLGLSTRVRFQCQDLACADFEIPSADAYYLYDPFCESTYRRVVARIEELSTIRPVTVVAKDGARGSFFRLAQPGCWSPPEVVDQGMLHLFRSISA